MLDHAHDYPEKLNPNIPRVRVRIDRYGSHRDVYGIVRQASKQLHCFSDLDL